MNQEIFPHTDVNSVDFFRGIENGYATVKFDVFGYWGDVVRVDVKRDYFRNNDWVVEVSHSSGGRDTNKVKSSIVAERNMGKAMIAAADLAESLVQRSQEFEEIYQKYRQCLVAEYEMKQKAIQEKIDADPAIGDNAEQFVNELDSKSSFTMVVYNRGEDNGVQMTFSTNRRGRKVYRLGEVRLDREGITRYFSNISARSNIVEQPEQTS